MPRKTTSEASEVHEARVALGRRLRELRRQAHLSGKQLAESLAWVASKISKLENGKQTPTEDDIRAWTNATKSEDEAESLLATLRTMEERHAEWRKLLSGGMRHKQHQLLNQEAEVRFFRLFEPDVISGLLQVPAYARAVLQQGELTAGTVNDLDDAVHARMQRQRILYDADKRFHFVFTEASLRYRFCAPADMLAQLDRLVSLSTLPNVKLGIIAFETKYPRIGPWHGFWIRDEDSVAIETFSAELNLAQPHEIELYGKIFESLAGIASYGRAARQIIMRVIDDLSPEVDEDPPTG